jgi:hypothetical protein
MKKIHFAIAMAAVIVSTTASAAGGLSTGTGAIDEFKVWFFGILALLSTIYLGAQGAQLASNKIQWSDFGQSVMKTAVTGAGVTLAGWAFALWAF